MLAPWLAFASVASEADHEAAKRAVRSRDYAQAAKIWHRLAGSGDAEAAYRLGALYRSGRGVKQDPELAHRWLSKAAGLGYEKAQRALVELGRPERELHAKSPQVRLRQAIERGDLRSARDALAAGADVNGGKERSGAVQKAIVANETKLLRFLLSKGADPELRSAAGVSPLDTAVEVANAEAVAALLTAGASPRPVKQARGSALHTAARLGELEIVDLLIRSGAPIGWRDASGRNALDVAILADHGLVAKRLRAAGGRSTQRPQESAEPTAEWISKATADLTGSAYDGWPALSVAAWRGQDSVVRGLLEGGADPNALDPERSSALARASTGGHEGVVRILISAKADPNAGEPPPLFAAAEAGERKIVRLLLAAGASVERKDLRLRTALHVAAKAGDVPIMRELLEAGAPASARDKQATTPLELAALGGHMDALELLASASRPGDLGNALCLAAKNAKPQLAKSLIQAGAEVRTPCPGGLAPLLVAATASSAETVEALLKAGADVNARSKAGNTALIFASHSGNQEMVSVLAQNGADLDVRGADSRTALLSAAAGGHELVVQELAKAGADLRIRDAHGNTAAELATAAGHDDIATQLNQQLAGSWF